MALKSVKFLLLNKKTSFACFYGLKLFKEYSEKNKDKINENFKDKVEEVAKEDIKTWEEADPLKKIAYKIYYEKSYEKESCTSENIKSFLDMKKEDLRATKNVRINNFYSWVSLFLKEKEEMKKLKGEVRNKLKIDMPEEIILKNVDFYEVWKGDKDKEKEEKPKDKAE